MDTEGYSLSGRFLTIEGGEGVGKTSFIAALCRMLTNDYGVSLLQTFEPGGTDLANRYREIFESPPAHESMHIETEFLTVAAARAQHVRHLVKPTLAVGKWVICDRFTDSSRVYQGYLGGIALSDIDAINHFATDGLEPELTFLLDCDVQVSLNRVGHRARESGTKKSRFDAAPRDYHQKIRDAYLSVAKAHAQRIVVLDAARTGEQVLQSALRHLSERSWL